MTEIAATLAASGFVFAKHAEIAVAYLFGSHARGTATPESDIDLGVVYRSRAPAPELHDNVATALASDVARLTGISRVDVVDLADQGPIFCHQVLLDGTRVYVADPERRVDFESDVVIRAFDFRPTYELATRGKIRALRRWLKEHHDIRTGAVEARRPERQSGQAR